MINTKGNLWPATVSVMLLLLTLMACAPTSAPVAYVERKESEQPPVDHRLEKNEIQKINDMIFSQATISGDPGEYLLGAGDLLVINVFEAEELETTVRVSSRGFITLPLLETVTVKGLTAIEAEKRIESLYREQYIKDPHVSVFVKEHVSQRVTLVGQFNKPGTYDYPSKLRLLDVIALGGGLSDEAGQMVQIRKARSAQTNGQPNVFMVDLDQLITQGNVQLNIEINGGDVIFIPEAGVFFVDGAVKRPGAYAIKHQTSLHEALVEAGGFEHWALKDKLKLVRKTESGKRELIELDLNRLGVMEMEIIDRDILVVDENASAGMMRGFGISILGTGFSYSGR